MPHQLVRQVREALGLTQQDFAAALAVSQATVSRWEAGRSRPDPATRRRIHAMARREGGLGDAPLFNLVQRAPSIAALFDLELHLLAISELAAAANAMAAQEAVGMDYRPLMTDEFADGYEQAIAGGLLTGDILSAEIVCRVRGLRGAEFFAIGSWHVLTRPTTGDAVLMWNGRHVPEAEYRLRRAETPVRLITLDDWMDSAWTAAAAS